MGAHELRTFVDCCAKCIPYAILREFVYPFYELEFSATYTFAANEPTHHQGAGWLL
jgi:hypothetical protein